MFEVSYDILLAVLVCAYFAVVVRGLGLQRDFYDRVSELQTKEDARRYEAMVVNADTHILRGPAIFLRLIRSQL